MTIRKKRVAGGLLLTAAVAGGITLIVGVAAGLSLLPQSVGCDDVLQRYDANEPVTDAEIERCMDAFQNQLRTLAGAANFIPNGADEAVVLAPLGDVVDRLSQPAPTRDEPLPGAVEVAATGWPGQVHCTTRSGFLNPFGDTPFCYASDGFDVALECASEGNTSGGGPCPGGLNAVACIRFSESRGSTSITAYYDLSFAGIAEARESCERGGEGLFARPWNP